MKQITVTLFAVVFLASTAAAQKGNLKQQQPFQLGVVDHIQSAALAENRTLNIYLPEGYSPDAAATYPVIYLLDGSANEDFVHVTGLVQFFSMLGMMRKTIVVGLANVGRRHDFTFPTTIDSDKVKYPTTGGSAKYISFMEKELQPFIKKHYKANSERMLIGQSLGGLLAAEVLLKKPELFDSYVIVSPSLWWDGESLLKKAPALLAKNPDKQTATALIIVGSEGAQMQGDAKQLNEIITAAAKSNLRSYLSPLPQENHLTILHNAVYKALLFFNPSDYNGGE